MAGVTLRKVEHASCWITLAPVLVRLLLRRGPGGKWFTWEHARSMVYLEGWHRVLRQNPTRDATAIVLDHGPIFRLALLRQFGPGIARSEPFETWWNRMLDEWAGTLDMVVSLDAPDPVLFQRVRSRDRGLGGKGSPEEEAHEFLALYRKTYKEILTRLSLSNEVGPLLLRFDTHRSSPDQISAAVLGEIESRFTEARPRAPQ